MERAFDLGEPPARAYGAEEASGRALEIGKLHARISQLEQALISAKRSKRAVDIEIVKLRSHLHEMDLRRGAGVSGYDRLGRILVEAATSFRGVLRLVPSLYHLARDEWRARPRAIRSARGMEFGLNPARDGSMVAQVHGRTRTAGHEAASAWVLGLIRISPKLKARLLMEIAKLTRATDLAAAIGLARQALKLDPTDTHVQWLTFALHDAGWVSEPAELVRQLHARKTPVIGVQAGLAERILAREALLTATGGLPEAPLPATSRQGNVFLFVSDILPLRWSLAACRFHLLALFLQAQGRQVIVACPSRPGSAQLRTGHVYETGGLRYAVVDEDSGAPSLRWLNDDPRSRLDIALGATEIGTIHASSQLSVCLQAMQLARRFGCRLVIDDEGDEPFAAIGGVNSGATEFTQLARRLRQERFIHANEVTSPWRLMPMPEKWTAENLNLREHSILQGRRVIGFVGEQAPEYDLAVIPGAFRHIADAAGKVALLMAGVGRALDLVEEQLVEHGWDHDVLILHRPPATELAGIYASMDLFLAPTIESAGVLDRAPIEILMAVRFGVPVVAGDSAASRQWKAAGLPVLLAERSDAASLASTTLRVLLDPQIMKEARRQVAAWNAAHTSAFADSDS